MIFFDFSLCFHQNKDDLTIFTDYRAPQILTREGIVRYSDRLKERLYKKYTLEFNDPNDFEFRTGSILTAHLIVDQVNENIPLKREIGVESQQNNSILVDIYIWR